MNTEETLWECADLIRGNVDRTEYTDVFLPPAFMRYLDAGAADLGLTVPEGSHWEDLLTANTDISDQIDNALEALREANEGVEVDTGGFTGIEQASDAMLRRIIQCLDRLEFDDSDLDDLSRQYSDLVFQLMAEQRRGGIGATPPAVSRLMALLSGPFEDGDTVHDPTCGTGRLLAEASRTAREQNAEDVVVTGQEINPKMVQMARTMLTFEDVDADIREGDSLTDPQFVTEGELTQYDHVLADFPFSADWDREALEDDPHNRFFWTEKLPRKDRGDYAFLYHQLAHAKPDGKVVSLIPHGMLFRKTERRFREALIENDLIEAVIGLPENLMPHTSISTAIVVLNKEKPRRRRGQVLFIQATGDEFYQKHRNRNTLTDNGIRNIHSLYEQWEEVNGVSSIVDIEDLHRHKGNMNIALHVDTTSPVEGEIQDVAANLREIAERKKDVEDQVFEYLEVLGYEE